MLINIWHYLSGYVIIDVTGFSVERFVNLAAHRGIHIWDVQYMGSAVRMKVTTKAFRKLRACARKTGCKYKIAGKKGYPFVANRYRKRKLFAFGTVAFIIFLYFMSTFIWLVEIDGTDRIDPQELLSFCRESGLHTGAKKGDIDRKALEQAIMFEFQDVSFINIGIKGTRAKISIAETIPKQAIVDKSTPCDIIAKKDGIISHIFVSNGTPAVREKDVVSKGDVLVKGELIAGVPPEETMVTGYVHAQAEVRARLYYDINFKVNRSVTEKIFTGKEKTAYSLIVLNKELKLFDYSNLYANYDKITERTQMAFGEDYPLPAIIVKETYMEYEPVTENRTTAQMKELASIMLNNRIIREFDFEADIVDKIIEYTEDSSGLTVNAVVITNEDIGEIRYLNSSGAEGETADTEQKEL